jgi:hypothetical protein
MFETLGFQEPDVIVCASAWFIVFPEAEVAQKSPAPAVVEVQEAAAPAAK